VSGTDEDYEFDCTPVAQAVDSTPTEPGWYWVELGSGVFVVEVRRWGREPHRLTFADPCESKLLLIPMVSPLIRSWGPRVPDWSPRA
jgi:hypothetical protein